MFVNFKLDWIECVFIFYFLFVYIYIYIYIIQDWYECSKYWFSLISKPNLGSSVHERTTIGLKSS